MENILVLTHADETGSTLTRASLEAVTAGMELSARLGAPLAIGVIATDATVANSLAETGAGLFAVSSDALAQPRYATDAAACEALCRAAGATIVLLPLAIASWPAVAPSMKAWGSVIALGVACTGIAYMLFFHLIAIAGPARAITVTFVIPIFGILWGALFLGERVSLGMIEGCAVILVGTALATGVIKRIPGFGGRRVSERC